MIVLFALRLYFPCTLFIVSTEDSSTKIRAEVINASAGDAESLLSKINELLS